MDAASYDSLGSTSSERVLSLAGLDLRALWLALESIPEAGETWVRVIPDADGEGTTGPHASRRVDG